MQRSAKPYNLRRMNRISAARAARKVGQISLILHSYLTNKQPSILSGNKLIRFIDGGVVDT